MKYFVETVKAKLLICTKKSEEKMRKVAEITKSELLVLDIDSIEESQIEPNINVLEFTDKNGLILFTSGTTGKSY